jgi:hypothetical protein
LIDAETKKLTFLSSVWKRRKDKMISKSKTIKVIKDLKKMSTEADPAPENESLELLQFLPTEGKHITGEEGDGIVYDSRTMRLLHEAAQAGPPAPVEELVPQHRPTPPRVEEPDGVMADSDPDPVEVTLTDFMSEQTDSDLVTDWRIAINGPDVERAPIVPRKPLSQMS